MNHRAISFLFFCAFICGFGLVAALATSTRPDNSGSLIAMALALWTGLSGLVYGLINVFLFKRLALINPSTWREIYYLSIIVASVLVIFLSLKANSQLHWPTAFLIVILAIVIFLFLKRRLKVG